MLDRRELQVTVEHPRGAEDDLHLIAYRTTQLSRSPTGTLKDERMPSLSSSIVTVDPAEPFRTVGPK